MKSERKYQQCVRCVMDTTDSKIVFDKDGVCDHCLNYDQKIIPIWDTGAKGKEKLDKLVKEIKKDGKGKEYDCIIGISGGVDSSYLLYYAKEVLGLRPLAYSVDTGWTLPVATRNVDNIVDKLGLKLHNNKIDFEQMADLQLAFFKSQVPYQDMPQDHVIFAALYNTAVKHKIKHVLTGGNFSTEGVREPNEWVHQNDLRLMKDIHKKFGKNKIDRLPLTSIFKYRIYYRFFKGMKVHKPLDYIKYVKKDIIRELIDKFDYEPYANKHFESIFTRYYEGYWLIKKFGYDKRKAHFSSLILSNQLSREEALNIIKNPPYPIEQAMKDEEYIVKKLGISQKEFQKLMEKPNKTYKDYKNSLFLINTAVKFAQIIGMEKRNFR